MARRLLELTELLLFRVTSLIPNDFNEPTELLVPYWSKVINDHRIDHEHLFNTIAVILTRYQTLMENT